MSGKMMRFDSSQMEMGGPGKGAFTRYDHQKKPSSKPSSSKPVSNMPSRYLRMQDEELHVEETRNSFSPSQSRGRRVTTRNQEEQYLHEHYHEYETRNSFSPPQKEQQHEGDSIQTETCMSDDEDEEENIGSTSHVTRKETRALGETRKIQLNKGSLVFEVDESFGRIIGKNSQGFITKGGCVMRKYAKLDGTTWKKQPDLLKTDIISKTTENSDFDFKCTRMRSAMSSQLGYQHRNHQYKLHLHYKEYETMEEAMTHPPKGIEVSDWVLLCERFASEDFQKISEKNKKNRSKNLVPPTVGTRSLARRVDESRREGKEVSEIEQYKMAHYSKKLKGMINEEADTIWNDLQAEEATSSCTSAEICLKKLGHLPGHIKGRSASTKQILETVNLRSELKALKEENKATNEKVDYLLEEMKKMAQLQPTVSNTLLPNEDMMTSELKDDVEYYSLISKKRKDEAAKRAAEVEGVEENEENDNEPPPTEEQIKKARKEILNVSLRDQNDGKKLNAHHTLFRKRIPDDNLFIFTTNCILFTTTTIQGFKNAIESKASPPTSHIFSSNPKETAWKLLGNPETARKLHRKRFEQ
ncbi:Myb domain protein 62 [Tanacetum coccineum]